MRAELDKLVAQVENPEKRKAFGAEMAHFHELFSRYLNEKGQKL